MSQQRTTNSEQKAVLAEIEKELQAETSKEAAPLLEFVLENIQKIILGLVLIIALIGVFGFTQWRSDANFAKSDTEFQRIAAIANPNTRASELVNFAPSAHKDLKIAVDLELARAYVQDDKLDLAASTLAALIKSEKNTPLATALVFSLADVYSKDDKPAQALTVLEEYLLIAPQSLRPNLLEEIASNAIASANTTRAISAYNLLLTMPETAQSHTYYQEKLVELSQ